jgi:hypothetical protein
MRKFSKPGRQAGRQAIFYFYFLLSFNATKYYT